jgi:hypothetical protein
MSVQAFSTAVQSQIYKQWLAKLEKNIIENSAKSLRSSQQVAAKTDFYITADTIQSMYKTITGKTMDSAEVGLLLNAVAEPRGTGKSIVQGKFTTIAGSKAVKFESIGFDTISSRLVDIFNEDYLVQEAYREAEEKYITSQRAELDKRTDLKGKAKQDEINKIEAEGARRAVFGYYFNKGHVIGLATNLTKKFREDLAKADGLSQDQRKVLTDVLDQYINKLQADDLASANLPDAVNQELYASYIKSGTKYLVEIQCAVKNQGAGRDEASPVLAELRKLFSITSKDVTDIINNSPALGTKLLETQGSPSFISLLAKNLAEIIDVGKRTTNKEYTQGPTLIGKNSTKIKKPKSNAQKIEKAKKLKTKVQAVKKDPNSIVVSPSAVDLTSLLLLLNAQIQDVVSANMGSGSSKNILNYRTGRLASSVNVEYLTIGRTEMITAYYSYMRNPYGTFSEGGRQSSPKSRDPKLLIAKSIRDIAAQKVGNTMRSILV